MNVQMSYLLGMIVGNGEVQRGTSETTIVIEIPHKKLETEFQKDVGIYVKASITDIRAIIEPLIGTGLKFSQSANVSDISFTKANEDYLMREVLRYIGNATTHANMRISPEVFKFTRDERVEFIRGFADVTGYIRRSNYFFKEPQYRVYFEIPQNWELVVDFCNLLKSVDIPVQNIDWGHPNMRDGNVKKYNEGKPDFWKKEHQVKIWALEFEPVGFGVIHKQEALDYFAHEHEIFIEKQGDKKDRLKALHRYYWELTDRKKEKPSHPGENDPFIPEEIRGKHFDSWKDIAKELGYNEESEC
ncbi:hypothetical protein D6853_09015 [Butyrivibrio sp. X503]|uniref:hypothetical protein n=1 Tax=Butyrivibrio sp. X503 TaxID=2364878 RepID=UPI000EA85781|nr:hypothetical protein [Butyrivibrio sp. X503]RKM55686.1 hypothetical protein D6853_09015 [Butyrivibrio sp. X503]